MAAVDLNKLWATLDELGETKVREKLASKLYGEQKRPLVEEWLRQKAESRSAGAEDRHISVLTDQNKILRSTRSAAWFAAVMAAVAAICAVIAVVN